ncbi:MAG TPA: MFS transporter [Streptosporangiaceae bacterium]|nr:MFS transporter [Streptosporangiaceae bacterium]
MGWGEAWAAAKQAGRAVSSAAQSGGRAGAGAARGTTRMVHRLTGASGASRTGLQSLIELSAAGAAGDAFVTIALAGTLFFSTSLDQARGRIALTLLITMAPFAVLAPIIGPMLDRARQGRRYLLAGTLMARGLLCWGMVDAVLHNDVVALLPAAFGVLVLQKAYAVTRASVTPRLLPREITLVTANSRTGMASLIASSVAGLAALGIEYVAGGGANGAAWVLRVGTVVYIAATALSFRVPDHVDAFDRKPAGDDPGAATVPNPGPATAAAHTAPGPGAQGPVAQGRPGPRGPGGTVPLGAERARTTAPGRALRGGPAAGRAAPDGRARSSHRPGLRTLRQVGPVVAEAMRANATLRAFSGFTVFFLAFLLRTVHFHGVNDKVALGGLLAAATLGGFGGTAVGSALRSHRPYVIMFGMLGASTLVSVLGAMFFGLWAALAVALVAAFGQVLVKLALDSTVQQEIGEDIRSSAFAASETLHQLAWVCGGLAGVALSLTNSGVAGMIVAAVGLGMSLLFLLSQRRRRILAARHSRPQVVS